MKIDMKNVKQVNAQLGRMATVVKTDLPERIFLAEYRNMMVKRMAQATRDVKTNMRELYVTRTGLDRKAGGGRYAGRDTTGSKDGGGQMVRSFRLDPKTGTAQNGFYRFRAGWDKTAPNYTLFQEYGTKSGIEGMNALGLMSNYVRDIVNEAKAKQFEFSFMQLMEQDIKVLRGSRINIGGGLADL